MCGYFENICSQFIYPHLLYKLATYYNIHMFSKHELATFLTQFAVSEAMLPKESGQFIARLSKNVVLCQGRARDLSLKVSVLNFVQTKKKEKGLFYNQILFNRPFLWSWLSYSLDIRPTLNGLKNRLSLSLEDVGDEIPVKPDFKGFFRNF